MKILQFLKENELRLGVKTSHGILDVKDAADKLDKSTSVSLQELILEGEEGLGKINSLVHLALEGNRIELFVSEGTLTYAPAVSNPEKIICVGLNYMDHAKESNMDTPKSPVLFSKFNNALSAHFETISIPEEAKNMDYEAELVVVMGKTAKNVSEEDALSYVFGYSVGNDVSARDLQFKSGQWLLGKTPDGFAPVGPYIVTTEEVDPNNLAIECRVNGEVHQKANTRDMIFSCAFLISYISQYITLKPGDLIYTGTPEGVTLGYPEGERAWLKSGDEMVVAIESLGELKNVLK
ncbi:2-keto-4-pentenoate hydratase/2-oxohepta-3-ene-1,7-dioic acid hydratase (catechol pathway) [Peribacillus simplex]|uniref:2-keto-4-pentenoate hydratase/2-oxohepta-3-ene-1,7-dioic acid hydratase (Catechol pathway) n=1 Tax=Peribacillus simplex TaxID=1478 RepID=A0A9X8RDV0_9BACI|nr:fumarylacetoacetate hydrolase family protein [Peribacillus simplex]SIS03541.1 2-keto-4-pentenoate hydratase/2-oxohepta-3-ene-1,7-dioic acid hydratase (catechol pathway) [Peribacillus simplex]